MQIKLQTTENLTLKMTSTLNEWDAIKQALGKLTLYEMRRCGISQEEIRIISEFHTELSRLVQVVKQ
jgi:hypothetical protein